MIRLANLVILTLLIGGAVTSPAAASQWKCWAHSADHKKSSWGKAASEAEAKGLALGNCNGASHENCTISDCHLFSDDDAPQKHVCIAKSPGGGTARGWSTDLNEAKGLAKGRCDADWGGGCTVASCT